MQLLEVVRRFVVECLMDSLEIIKCLDALECARKRTFKVSEAIEVGLLMLRQPEESCYHRAFVAATCPTH